MSDELEIDRDLDFTYGHADEVQPGIRRLIANNPSPFTFHGTASYILGRGEVAIVDPGPDDDDQFEALLNATRNERITTILITHTHADHSPLAARLKEHTGATIMGCAPYVPSDRRDLGQGLDASHDRDYAPDRILEDGEVVEAAEMEIRALATPGHSGNHVAFELVKDGTVFSGDHVMAWSTSVVAPPDGNMADYMKSLASFAESEHSIYWPGHGGPVRLPQRFSRALLVHRKQRETSILSRLETGVHSIPDIVRAIYADLDPKLHRAAGLSVLAHLDDLQQRGAVELIEEDNVENRYRRA